MSPLHNVKNLMLDYNSLLENPPEDHIAYWYEKIQYLDDLIPMALQEKERGEKYYTSEEYDKMIAEFRKEREIADRSLKMMGKSYERIQEELRADWNKYQTSDLTKW